MNRLAKAAMKIQCLIHHELGQSCPESAQRLEQALDDLLFQVYQQLQQAEPVEMQFSRELDLAG